MSVSEALDSVCRDIICSFPSFPKLPCAILISEFTLTISFSKKTRTHINKLMTSIFSLPLASIDK